MSKGIYIQGRMETNTSNLPDGDSSRPRLVKEQSDEAQTEKSPQNYSLLSQIKTFIHGLTSNKSKVTLEESVVELIEEHNADGKEVSYEERELLHNLLESYSCTIGKVMVPRKYIIATDIKTSFEVLKDLIVSKEHTRIPIYEGNMDNIRGFIHIRDIIPFIENPQEFSIEKIIREALFVPPSMKVVDLITKMRLSRVHIALVMDEYGGTEGLVTIEDLLEEIVGDIEDEFGDNPHDQQHILEINDSSFEVSAGFTIDELEERLNVTLSTDQEDEYDTVSGLICAIAGYVPKKGEKIVHSDSNLIFEIIDADPRCIHKVKITY